MPAITKRRALGTDDTAPPRADLYAEVTGRIIAELAPGTTRALTQHAG
ncbi:hypothetical protein [Sphingomonas sp.]